MSSLIVMNIPLPALTRYSAKGSQYDFAALQVGGPALVDQDVIDPKKAHSRVSSALTAYRKRTGDMSKFTVRITQVDGKDVIGVWKLENPPVAAPAPAPVAADADAPAADASADTVVDAVVEASVDGYQDAAV